MTAVVELTEKQVCSSVLYSPLNSNGFTDCLIINQYPENISAITSKELNCFMKLCTIYLMRMHH